MITILSDKYNSFSVKSDLRNMHLQHRQVFQIHQEDLDFQVNPWKMRETCINFSINIVVLISSQTN